MRTRHIYLLIATQTACVAVGLWTQHRYVCSSLRQSLEQREWDRLEVCVRELASDHAGLARGEWHYSRAVAAGGQADHPDVSPDVHRDASGDPESPCGPAGFTIPPSGGTALEQWHTAIGLALLDPAGRVCCTAQPAGGTALEQWHTGGPADVPPMGKPLTWSPAPEQDSRRSSGDEGVARGWVSIAGQPQLAVIRQLEAHPNHRLVAYTHASAVTERTAELAGSLAAIEGVALVWIIAVLTITVFVMLGRRPDGQARESNPTMLDVLSPARNLVRTRDAVIFGLAKLADSRDRDTGEHLERICAYATVLATELRRRPRYTQQVTPAFVRLIGISAALHDIGKVGIEDRILLKPRPFTPDERAKMQTHTLIGGRCLEEIEQRLGSSNFLQMAREITLAHHERWDGTGYPFGLAGPAIPLAARIVAIADVYDALSSRRVYKEPYEHADCVSIIREEAGRHFDPDLVNVWLEVESKFKAVARQYAIRPPRPNRTEHDGGAGQTTESRPASGDQDAPKDEQASTLDGDAGKGRSGRIDPRPELVMLD